MRFSQVAAAVAVGTTGAAGQVFKTFTDANGIDFWQATWSTTLGQGDAQWGMALPAAADTSMANEYIGRLVVPRVSTGTWMGLSHESSMTDSLLLVTWVDGSNVKTSFRYASGYVAPDIYTGNATLSQISSNVNDTHYELTYRCEGCWSWDQDGATASQVPATTSAAAQLIGWAQATNPPTNPSDAGSGLQQHANDGIFGALVASARNPSYTNWVTKATAAPTATGVYTNATGTGVVASATATPTPVACPATNTLANSTFDYIIVGAGAGGIPLADKLSETGATVLLIEKGPPSSGRWGGNVKPDWLAGTNLTRFDVPGLDNEIWANSTGIACEDYSVMAGCVLGGGTAINAGLWWRANPADFDYNFPAGWKSADMQPAIARVFNRIPFTERPSTDGILYKPEGYNIVGGALAAAGWKNVSADTVPGEKNLTFSHPDHMFSHGERGGPLATYLVTANTRKNFKLIMNTGVNRVVRDGSRMTGVEMQAFLPGGLCGTVNVTPKTGKVILSAGAFGTPKILFRSGIGPQDQLEIVQAAEGSKMVKSSEWLNLPVGYNLDDHTNTDVVITHPNVSFYDFYAAYNTPILADKNRYLGNRTGILTQSAPNLATVFWQEIVGADGITRQLQYTARVESAHSINSTKAMTISQYLGRGKTSRGRTVINGALAMSVSVLPYLNNEYDLAAVTSGLDFLKASLATDPAIKMVYPPSNQTTADFLAAYPITTGQRSANHWMGSCKMGLDSGLVNNGTAVVDTNAKVYGTDNLFVVDASVFPGMVSTNPSALIVSVAEHAAQLIPAVKIVNTTVVDPVTAPSKNGTASASRRSGSPTGTASPTRRSGSPTGVVSLSSVAVSPVNVSSTQCTQSITITRNHPTGSSMLFTSASAAHAFTNTTSSVLVAAVTASSSQCTTNITITRSETTTSPTLLSSVSAPVAIANTTSSVAVGAVTASSSQCTISITITRSTPVGSATSAISSAAGPTATAGAGSVAEWQQCGGSGYTGASGCAAGLVLITIAGAGLEAGERVLDLTSPLAIAGISIHFITSYWSDYILVPFAARSKVICALVERGFVFEAEDEGEAGQMTNPASPLLRSHHRHTSSHSSFDLLALPTTPPPSTVSELQVKTFKTLARNNVSPAVDPELQLVTCAANKNSTASLQAAALTLGLLKCLTTSPLPRFFSLTLTDAESASLTLDQKLLPLFPNEGEDILLGKDGPEQVAITLDLQDLPRESTGIVCGVASRLINGMKGRLGRELFNMSYLSTAKAGYVIVYRDELDDAMAALRGFEVDGVNGRT
ncbi:hypothetical protein B0A54_02328 [Friedmanniomyces endolithicus]|uniref:Glucose-methanol-choline oxidoreductase N-terminal domain-containing protein n=1 Tax=Friedmanniomyces endolithicus TaxID=329885 RepID=A0A4U0VEB4_9PEZI|nr:hypothetical protein B0A54_02328 [Friedmanniomyces endolithicus]